MEIYSKPWFRTRLDYYLRERHPQLQYRAQLLDRRSAVAADLYRRICDAGGSAECALRLADRSLFRGLLFSKFDTIDLILANDFPDIPEDQRRTVARALLTPCEPIFAGYALGDDFASRPEFRQLKAELRLGIRQWIDDNGPPGYEAKLRHRVRTRKMRDGEPKKTNRNK